MKLKPGKDQDEQAPKKTSRRVPKKTRKARKGKRGRPKGSKNGVRKGAKRGPKKGSRRGRRAVAGDFLLGQSIIAAFNQIQSAENRQELLEILSTIEE